MRREILRPHQSIEHLASHETEGVYALGAFDRDGEVVSVGFVEPEGEPGAWRVRGMATRPDVRGRGAGAVILAGLLEYAVAEGATRVWCNARVRARSLYERAGFKVVSGAFEVPEIGPHLVMEWLPPRAVSQETSATDA